MCVLLGPSGSSPPSTLTTLTGAASRGHDPLASETPPDGTPWWLPLPPVPPPIPPPAGPGGRVRVPGVRPGPAGPAAPLGGKEAACAGCLGAVAGLSVGGGAGGGYAPPILVGPRLLCSSPAPFRSPPPRFCPCPSIPRPRLWALNALL